MGVCDDHFESLFFDGPKRWQSGARYKSSRFYTSTTSTFLLLRLDTCALIVQPFFIICSDLPNCKNCAVRGVQESKGNPTTRTTIYISCRHPDRSPLFGGRKEKRLFCKARHCHPCRFFRLHHYSSQLCLPTRDHDVRIIVDPGRVAAFIAAP